MENEGLFEHPGYYKVDEFGSLVDVTQLVLEKQARQYELMDFAFIEGNNEEIYVKDDTQKLTAEEIEALKQTEADPSKIIKTIAQNNANFQMRFEFSKQKYLDKKERKYNLILNIQRCTIENLNSYYILKHNEYVFNREDSLAFVLNHVYPEPSDNIFIMEKAKGIITAAILDRISDFGQSQVFLFNERAPVFDIQHYDAVKLLSVEEASMKKLAFVTKSKLPSLTARMNFVVLANDGGELETLKTLRKQLAPNCQIVVHSRYYEVIKDLYEFMIEDKGFVNMRFTDYFYRVYQALPMRTHPTMQGNTCSSFFLFALKTAD